MGIVDSDEWEDFVSQMKAGLSGEVNLTVRDVCKYMFEVREKTASKGKRLGISRAISSVLKAYGFDDLVSEIRADAFISARGAGERSYLMFMKYYRDLRDRKDEEMRERWGRR